MNRCVFYSLALYVREANNYQEIMKIYIVISILLLTQMHIIPQKGENGSAPPAKSQGPLRYRPDERDINYSTMVVEADFIMWET